MYGNVALNMVGVYSRRVLNETDFNMLYHLEQITGFLSFREIPQTSRIILPNLRIIQGQNLIYFDSAMLITLTDIEELILPKLTQITQGNVAIQLHHDTDLNCKLARVNWLDILDNGMLIERFVGNCRQERKS